MEQKGDLLLGHRDSAESAYGARDRGAGRTAVSAGQCDGTPTTVVADARSAGRPTSGQVAGSRVVSSCPCRLRSNLVLGTRNRPSPQHLRNRRGSRSATMKPCPSCPRCLLLPVFFSFFPPGAVRRRTAPTRTAPPNRLDQQTRRRDSETTHYIQKPAVSKSLTGSAAMRGMAASWSGSRTCAMSEVR